jgi:PilZ domain-containing protein
MCSYQRALPLPNIHTHPFSNIPSLACSSSHVQRASCSASLKVDVNFTFGARKAIRFPLQAPVVFWWTDENGNHQQGEGRSRDISESGTFVHAASCPPLGASVGLRVSLEVAAGATETLPIEFDGHVLRVERVNAGGESSGFAVLRRTS